WTTCRDTTRAAGSSTWRSGPAIRLHPARFCRGPAPAAIVRRVRALIPGRGAAAIVRFVLPPLLAVGAPGPTRAQPTASLSAAAADSAAALRDVGDLLAVIFRRPVRTEVVTEARPGLSLTLLPSLGYNPSYGAFAGVSVSIGGWLGERATTQLSAGSLGASYSTTGQISVQFRSDFYLPDNRWVLKGDWRYLDTS